MTETTSAEAVQRELGGCPVMHRDFSGSQAAGCHWELAEELREASPLYFNTFAQGYWVFTRYDAVRDMYKNPEIFSSESITPWQPDPIYRFVPTQIDPPDHIQYRRILNPWFSPRAIDDAEARMRGAVPPARRGGRPDRRLRLRQRVRAALSHRGVPERDRHRSRRRRPLRAVGRGLLQRLRRRSGRAGAHDRGPRGHSRVLGGRAGGPSWRARAPARRPRLASPARDLRRPPAHRRRDARHADGARPRRAGHDARRARLHVQASRRSIPSTVGCSSTSPS